MMTRREFLKRLGLFGVAALVGGYEIGALVSARELTKGGRSISRTTGAPRYPVPSTCLMCPARCGIIGYLEDEALVKIEGNPKDPENRGGICAKGLAGVQYLYNPDRLLHPLKRVGPRGSGRWERISWEEAYTEVVSRLRELEGAEGGLVLIKDFRAGPLAERFARAWGDSIVLDEDSLYYANRAAALNSLWGAEEAVSDAAHAKYILNFGANLYETHRHLLPLVRRVIEARMNGAKLITFDPRVSNTAGRSNEWFPIKPGTDGLVALTMANLILQLGLYDKEFIKGWLNYPLEGLAAHLRQYTPEMAASVSGVKASHIRRIAIEFATTKPATVITGGGVSEHLNGAQNERAIFLLPALTGNIDARGGLCLPRSFQLAEPPPQPPPAESPVIQEALSAIIGGELRVGLLLTCSANPAFTSPATRLITNLLQDEGLIPYHVAITSYMSETAALADLVLPAATYLESFGLHSPPAYGMVP
ncbi:MAG: molybdopterin-dependent oxidoreductase, partial [Candidatus Bipolaricaulia bacterium]